MKLYKNRNNNSGVTHYEVGENFIKVRFINVSIYLYNYAAPGKKHVIKMKSLAIFGEGLSTYISQYVKDNYALNVA